MNVAANKRSQSAPMRSAIALRLQWRCQPANQDLSTYVFWVRIWILQLKNVTLKGLPGPFKSQDQSYFHGTKRMSSSPQSNTGHNVCLRCTTGTLVSWLREVQVWSQTHLKHAAFFLSYAQTNKNDHTNTFLITMGEGNMWTEWSAGQQATQFQIQQTKSAQSSDAGCSMYTRGANRSLRFSSSSRFRFSQTPWMPLLVSNISPKNGKKFQKIK